MSEQGEKPDPDATLPADAGSAPTDTPEAEQPTSGDDVLADDGQTES